MAMEMQKQDLFINLDLGDIRRGAEARNKLLKKASEIGQEDDAKPKTNRTPDYVQSLTGKGFLLDIVV